MKRIILSLLIVGVVTAAATTATLAFFTSAQQIEGSIISNGNISFVGVLTKTDGTVVSNFSENNIAPGMTATRCLWVRNAGSLPGRFKLYRSGGSGATLGKLLYLSTKLNPQPGEPCNGLASPPDFTGVKYGPAEGISKPEWQNLVMYGGAFDSLNYSPLKISESDTAMLPGEYTLLSLTIMMDVSPASRSTTDFKPELTLFGMQKEGSDVGTGWDATPAPSAIPTIEPSPTPTPVP
jgi:hypothetical protein